MKDPYIFDIMGQTDKMAERDIERQLVSHITKYLLKMGNGFAFVAQQKHFEVGDYQLTKVIPDNLKSALPTVEEVEEALKRIIDK